MSSISSALPRATKFSVSVMPWPFSSTLCSQRSGLRSVMVARCASGVRRRPCAPGPMPAYSP